VSLTPGAVQAGMRLGDRYGLAEPIGSGGMARIYRAHDERLVRDVAVKILDPSNFEAQASVNEARAAARLTHPGLAQVFDVGRDQGLDYIVMELVPGRSLREVLAERRRLTPAETVAMTSAQGRVVIEASGWPFG
jgi:serine/threonine-protein kinase